MHRVVDTGPQCDGGNQGRAGIQRDPGIAHNPEQHDHGYKIGSDSDESRLCVDEQQADNEKDCHEHEAERSDLSDRHVIRGAAGQD